jgi:transposase
VFYKERWIRENDLEQRLIVTFSFKYKNYQRLIRCQQIERAQSLIEQTPARISRISQADAKRFIKKTAVTSGGEIANKAIYTLDEEVITHEEAFDGFYGVCTNLEDEAESIIKVNKRRWEIEECFRIIKHDFKARPVYLSRDKRIEAHFTTCFIALMVYRLLEKKLGNKYNSTEIIEGLRTLDFYKIKGEGYIPTYTRTDFTDDLHDIFGFRTDYQIITNQQMREIFRKTKK